MPDVHPTAILEGDVTLADDVVVGPNCVLTGPVTIGAGTTLLGNVYLHGPVTIGSGNAIYPFACLGFAPQHAKFDRHAPGHGLVVGNDNTFREHFTAHRAFTDEGPTTIGDRNLFMVGSHVGHDDRVGSDCTIANATLLAGHVTVGDRVTMGGNSAVHQFCTIGRGAMISGVAATTKDVLPFAMVTGISICPGMNLIGAKRAGFERDEIDDLKWIYRIACRDGNTKSRAVEMLRERGERPLVAEAIDFLEASTRGICTARVRARFGGAAVE